MGWGGHQKSWQRVYRQRYSQPWSASHGLQRQACRIDSAAPSQQFTASSGQARHLNCMAIRCTNSIGVALDVSTTMCAVSRYSGSRTRANSCKRSGKAPPCSKGRCRSSRRRRANSQGCACKYTTWLRAQMPAVVCCQQPPRLLWRARSQRPGSARLRPSSRPHETPPHPHAQNSPGSNSPGAPQCAGQHQHWASSSRLPSKRSHRGFATAG